ncbi:hypothetical protein KP509_24G040100 [Ceratopteris richardii]|nr:hypothetical protein KP509_24G040100 [Ceratopteris richardii]
MLKGTEAKTLGKRDAPKGLPELLPLGKKFKDRRFSSTMFHVKSVKHHISKAERLVLPKKSPAQASGNTKAALVLYMQFPKDHPLPSESELKEVFSRFGTIETSGIKINKIASTAQVLFRDKAHAEKAWLYARKNRIFGPANVSYRLRHFSSSSNDDLKHFAVAFDKKSCPNILASSSTVQNLGASSMKEICMNRSEEESSLILSHSTEESLPKRLYPNDEFLRESEPVCKGATTLRCMPLPTGPTAMNFLNMESSTGIGDKEHISSNTFEPLEISPDEPKTESLVPAVPMCMGLSPGETDLWSSFRIPYESQHETILNPGLQSSFSTCSTNPSSEQNVNVHSGDIKDEMLKLLRQVSLIVNSTSLAPKNF